MVIVVRGAAPEDTQLWAGIESPAQGRYCGEGRALKKIKDSGLKDSGRICRIKKYMVDDACPGNLGGR
jgi:hypothetical protein